ncbi:DnaK family protein, partial [Toxoplasma gondii FOU]
LEEGRLVQRGNRRWRHTNPLGAEMHFERFRSRTLANSRCRRDRRKRLCLA